MFKPGDYVWDRRTRDSIWRVIEVRANGALLVRFVKRLDPSKRWLGSEQRTVRSDCVERPPDMLVIAAAAIDAAS